MSPGNQLSVAVVESQPLMRQGLIAALNDDQRLRVSLAESDPAALESRGAVFDVCVLDLAAVPTDGQVREIIGKYPVVVHTKISRWDQWVGMWLRGARGVVDRHVGERAMADVVWDAAHDQRWIGPQLAVALGIAIKECELVVDPRTSRLLELLAGGRRSATACAELGLSGADHEALLAELRTACAGTSLSTVDLCDGSRRPLRQLFSRVVPPVIGGLAEHIGTRTTQLADAVAALAQGNPPRLGTLTYHSVVDFFVTHQDAVPDARSGALVREPHPDGSVVRMFFLDDAGRPLVGGTYGGQHRSYIVHTVDDELDALFDGRDLILFT